MMLNPDKVPSTLDDAIATIRSGMTDEDYTHINHPNFSPAQLHFSVGMMIRNEWSMWDKETILVKWFKSKYDIDHADDISGLILDCLHRDIIGQPRRDVELAKRYIAHWKTPE
jgi:hypothetical protein